MRCLLLIAYLLYSGLGCAQNLSKKKVDAKTGDTTQMTREKMLFDPVLKNLVFGEDYKVGWRIEKLMAKAHHADTMLFFLHIYGGGFISNKNNNQLLVTFVDGHSLNLPLRNAWTNEYGGLPAEAPAGSASDTFAAYILNPEAIHEMITGQITAIKVVTTSGAVDYVVKANRALEIQKYLGNVTASNEKQMNN